LHAQKTSAETCPSGLVEQVGPWFATKKIAVGLGGDVAVWDYVAGLKLEFEAVKHGMHALKLNDAMKVALGVHIDASVVLVQLLTSRDVGMKRSRLVKLVEVEVEVEVVRID
jgi:hypothetical protein